MIPLDSSDVREQREVDLERQADAIRHDAVCRAGWLGHDQDERPVPCPQCRPHLFTSLCLSCGRPANVCDAGSRRGLGRCCGECKHRQTADLDELLDLADAGRRGVDAIKSTEGPGPPG